MFRIVGITLEGKRVVGGVFPALDRHGLPLLIIVERLQDANCLLDWTDLFLSALQAGWNPSTMLARIEETLLDVYGRTYCNAVLTRLAHCVAQSPAPFFAQQE